LLAAEALSLGLICAAGRSLRRTICALLGFKAEVGNDVRSLVSCAVLSDVMCRFKRPLPRRFRRPGESRFRVGMMFSADWVA
jgi:hypothetical protein